MLITDLDNTLYDWVTFFSLSFSAMVDEISNQINVNKEQLLKEFKTIHEQYKNTELPFTILELPSVKRIYPDLTRNELMEKIDGALYAFNSARKKTLKPYDSVISTLEYLSKNGFKIVGHTEAIMENGYYRLYKLDILKYFSRLYVLEGRTLGHPIPERERTLRPREGFIQALPPQERKPNTKVLLDICKREGVSSHNTWYIGDSLTRDVLMAKKAGVKAIWARYGLNYDKTLWDFIVKVSHWTSEDVQRETKLRENLNEIVPDYTIDSFSDILKIVSISGENSD